VLATLGHQQLPVSPGDHPLKTATIKPIRGETVLFEFQQCRQIFNHRQAKNQIHMTTVKVT
jgi:hypothetical protein